MSSRVRLLATILGIAGLTCAVWPRGDFHIGLGGPGEWGIGWPVPWFVYTYTPLGWHFGTEFARLSAAFGFLGLLCLLMCSYAETEGRFRPRRQAKSIWKFKLTQ